MWCSVTENLWDSRALPILRVIAAAEGNVGAFLSVGDISDATGIPPELAVPEIERLIDDGYVPGELKRPMSGGNVRPWYLTKTRVTGKGARAIDVWPAADDLLVALTELAQREPDPERRSKFARLLGIAREVGVQVLSDALARAAEHASGLR